MTQFKQPRQSWEMQRGYPRDTCLLEATPIYSGTLYVLPSINDRLTIGPHIDQIMALKITKAFANVTTNQKRHLEKVDHSFFSSKKKVVTI